MIVMLGGPTMNLLIYLVLTVILLSTLGTRHDDATTTVSAVVKCVVPANSSQAANDSCPANATPAPAYNVLKPGDVIVAIDGTRIAKWDDAVAIVEQSAGKPLSMTVRLSRRVAADPQLLRGPAGNPGAGIHR
jgi:membrane-associated protease RseP (regulator of RpoE activity)